MREVTTITKSIRRRGRPSAVLVAVALAVAATVPAGILPSAARAATATNRVGVVCTTDASPNPTFTLTTRTGYINLPDGTTAFMWGFSSGSDPFQHPGPVLCVNQGDTVTVILTNTLSKPVSISFPGQEGVLANGVPAQPEFDGGGALTSLTTTAAAGGGSVTYSFVASNPGTYIYESGTDPSIQVRMGLFGALLVRPTMGAGYVYNRADSAFNTSTEFLAILSEIDPYLNEAVRRARPFNMKNYHPRYWLINGRGFPDSIADNFASWLPSQPFGSLALIHPLDATINPLPSLTRYLNVGTEDYPFHPHGNNGLIVGRDGHPLEGATGQDQAFEKFSVNIGPGQTWDSLFSWKDNESYSLSNPVPVTEPSLQNLEVGMFYSGSPYLGQTEPMPPGIATLNECGEHYIISHNHALFQITSWGVNMTGPITYTRVDPPLPNLCP